MYLAIRFSAGGHLACSVGVLFSDPILYEHLGLSLNTPEVFGPGVKTVRPSNPEIRCWIDLAIRWITEL